MTNSWHTLTISTKFKYFDIFEQALDPFSQSVNGIYSPTANPEDCMEIIAYNEIEFPKDKIRKTIQYFVDEFQMDPPTVVYGIQENRNWVAENLQNFPPLNTSGFYIYGSHIHGADHEAQLKKLGDHIKLQIDASVAFGTGEHPTTKGCLQALRYIQEKNFVPKNILDMGCGSAILSMAAGEIYAHANIIGIDIDSEAIAVANYNLEINNLTRVNLYSGDGYQTKELENHGGFDLIFANILANPLISMSEDLSKHLKTGGYAIISGFIAEDSQKVQQAHHKYKLKTVKEFVNDDQWCSTILQKL